MANGYTIVGQSQEQELVGSGALRDVMTVTFTTDEGITGTVRVPLANYNPTTVAAAIEPLVAQFKAVGEM